jgi:molybdopterin converting factor small subunit
MSSESKTPLLDESRAADNEARMIQLNKELTNIVTKIGYAMKNYTTNKEESEKMIIEVVDELDELEKQYTFRNFLSFLKSSSKEFIKDVQNGVIDVFRNNGGSIIKKEDKVTFITPLGEESITNEDAEEQTCNPMHMKIGNQNGGFIHLGITPIRH